MMNPWLGMVLFSGISAFLLAALASVSSSSQGQISLVIRMVITGAVTIVPIIIECSLDLIRLLTGGG